MPAAISGYSSCDFFAVAGEMGSGRLVVTCLCAVGALVSAVAMVSHLHCATSVLIRLDDVQGVSVGVCTCPPAAPASARALCVGEPKARANTTPMPTAR